VCGQRSYPKEVLDSREWVLRLPHCLLLLLLLGHSGE
jgi:hypothetical protein